MLCVVCSHSESSPQNHPRPNIATSISDVEGARIFLFSFHAGENEASTRSSATDTLLLAIMFLLRKSNAIVDVTNIAIKKHRLIVELLSFFTLTPQAAKILEYAGQIKKTNFKKTILGLSGELGLVELASP